MGYEKNVTKNMSDSLKIKSFPGIWALLVTVYVITGDLIG